MVVVEVVAEDVAEAVEDDVELLDAERVVEVVSVRLEEYLMVTLVTLIRRYLRSGLVGGGSAR